MTKQRAIFNLDKRTNTRDTVNGKDRFHAKSLLYPENLASNSIRSRIQIFKKFDTSSPRTGI